MAPLKRIFHCVITVIMTINIAYAKKSDNLYEDALTAFHQEEYGRSIVLLKETMFQDPKHLSSRILLGRAFLLSRKFEDAENQFRQAIIDGADTSQIVIPLGQSLLYQGEFDALLEVVKHDVKTSVNQTEILALRGRAYLELNQFELARDVYESAIRFAPSEPTGYLGNAILELKLGNVTQGDIELNKVLKLDGKNAEALELKGDVLFKKGDLSLAQKYLEQSLAINKSSLRARLLLAEIYIAESEPEKALKHVSYVLELSPNYPNANLLYALVLVKLNKKNDAIKVTKNLSAYLSKIDEKDLNKYPSIRLILGTSLYIQESWENAYGHLNFYAQKYPGHEQSHLMVAELDTRFERYNAALRILEHYDGESKSIEYWLLHLSGLVKLKDHFSALIKVEQALEVFPKDNRLLEYKVKLLLATNNLSAALTLLEQLYQQGAASDELTLLLAQLQLDDLQLTQANAVVSTLLEKDTNNPIYLSLSAGVDLRTGRSEEAESKLKKAISLAPKMLQLYLNLHYVYLQQGKINLAAELLNQAYKKAPKSTFVITKLATLAEQVNNLAIAVDWRQKLYQLNPNDLDNLLGLSDNLIKLGQGKASLDLLLPQRINNRLNVRFLSGLAATYVSLKQCDSAVAVLDIWRGLSLENDEQLASVAENYMQCGSYELAHKSLENAEIINPKSKKVQLVRAQWLLNLKQGRLALKLLEPLADNADMKVLILQIKAYEQLKWYKSAIQTGRILYSKYPYPIYAYRLFELLKNNNLTEEGIHVLNSHLQQYENYNIRWTLALEYLYTGHNAEAVLHFSILAEQYQDARAFRQLAIINRQNKNKALAYAAKAFELDSASPAVAATYGWLLVQNDQPQKGLSHLRFAHARDSRQPTLLYRLAETLLMLNQEEQAKVLLKQAVQYDFPDKALALTRLESL